MIAQVVAASEGGMHVQNELPLIPLVAPNPCAHVQCRRVWRVGAGVGVPMPSQEADDVGPGPRIACIPRLIAA